MSEHGKGTIKIEDIDELTRWGFDCPVCRDFNETSENPHAMHREFIHCEHCGATITIEDD